MNGLTKKSKKKLKNYIQTNENENGNTMVPNLWDAAKVVLKGKFTAIQLPPETRKISNKQPNLIPKGARKRTTNGA